MDKFNKFSMDENSSRRTQSFKKAIPNQDQILSFTNALADFNCTLAEYEKIFQKIIFLLPRHPFVIRQEFKIWSLRRKAPKQIKLNLLIKKSHQMNKFSLLILNILNYKA